MDDGRTIDAPLCHKVLVEELDKLRGGAGDDAARSRRYEDAARLFLELIEAPSFPDFRTLPAYDLITMEDEP
jgi:malate synthase